MVRMQQAGTRAMSISIDGSNPALHDGVRRVPGTFDLAMHVWTDPFERVAVRTAELGIPLSTPMMGERVNMNAPQAGGRWWQHR